MSDQEKKNKRIELTQNQQELLCDVLRGLSGDMLGVNESDLLEFEVVFLAASKVCRKAAEIHHGLLVPYDKMCDSLLLPKTMANLKSTQDRMQEILELVGVAIVRQDNWERGAALPGFKKITREELNEIRDDLTMYSEEPSEEI